LIGGAIFAAADCLKASGGELFRCSRNLVRDHPYTKTSGVGSKSRQPAASDCARTRRMSVVFHDSGAIAAFDSERFGTINQPPASGEGE